MASIIGGTHAGVLDSSLYLLNRNDTTGAANVGDGESVYVNVATGDLVVRHDDTWLAGQGADLHWLRTYNSAGELSRNGRPWTFLAELALDRLGAQPPTITLRNADGSEFLFKQDSSGTGFVSTDGAGAFQTLTVSGSGAATRYTVRLSDQSTQTFDAQGVLVATRDTNGNELLYTYGRAGKLSLIQERDSTGRVTHAVSYAYDAANRLVSLNDETSRVLVGYGYDTAGRLASVTDRAGRITRYRYDPSDNTLSAALVGIDLPTQADSALLTSNTQYYLDWRLRLGITDGNGHGKVATTALGGGFTAAELQLLESAKTVARSINFEYKTVAKGDGADTRVLSALIDAEGNRTEFDYHLDVTGGAYAGGTTTMTTALGVQRLSSNAAEDVAWRKARGLYHTTNPATDGRYVPGAFTSDQALIRAAFGTTYHFDGSGAITRIDDPAVAQTTYTSGPDGKAVSHTEQASYGTGYVYDAAHNLTAIVSADGDAASRSDAPYYLDIRKSLGIVYTSGPETGKAKRAADLSTGPGGERERVLEAFTTRMTYDDRGNLLSRRDPGGRLVSYTYTAFNKLQTEVSAQGNALVLSDDAAARQKRLELGFKDPADPTLGALAAQLSASQKAEILKAYTTRYVYDESTRQNLVDVIVDSAALAGTAAGGRRTHFEYDAFGNVLTKTDFTEADNPARALVTRYEYGLDGQLRQSTAPDGGITTYVHDVFGNLLSTTDARGGVTSFTYDGANRLLTVTDPMGAVTTNTYDAVGNRIAVRDAAGHVVTAVYDRNNLLRTTADPVDSGPHAALDRVTRYTYDVNGNRLTVTDAEGRVTTYSYREDDRLIAVTTTPVPGADGLTSTAYTTTFGYDAEGHQINSIDRSGHLTRTRLDGAGLVMEQIDAAGGITRYTYDADGNRLSIVAGAQLPVEQQRRLGFRYDEFDELIAEVDALGGTTAYQYDKVGRKVQVTDANLHATTFAYDYTATGLRVTETRTAVADPTRPGQTVQYTRVQQFDRAGHLVSSTDENQHTITTVFDRNDRVAMVTDANGVHTVFTYDSRGNRTSVQVGVAAHVDAATGAVIVDSTAGAGVDTFQYDEFNQLVGTVDAVGNSLVSGDDPAIVEMRRTLGFVKPSGSSSGTLAGKLLQDLSAEEKSQLLALYTTRYTYDRVGNRVTATDHLGMVTRFEHDGLNRLVRTVEAAGNPALERVTSRSYDGNGQLVREVSANGHAAATSDDPYWKAWRHDAGFVDPANPSQGIGQAALNDTQRRAIEDRFTVTRTYDALDRLVSTRDEVGVVTRQAYDALGNLRTTSVDAWGQDSARTTTYDYFLDGRLRSVTDPDQHVTQSFQYDAVGNRRFVTDARGNTTEFVYDALNRNVKVIDPLTLETRFEYDGAGNRITLVDARGGVTRFAYDFANQLVSTRDAEGRLTEYAYDAQGNRISVVDPEAEALIHSDDPYYAEQRAALGITGPAAQLSDSQKSLLKSRHTTHFEYDAGHHLVAMVDGLGQRTTRTLDRNGNLVATADANGHEVRYGFDALNRQITVQDALGQTTRHVYDANGNALSVIDANGHETRFVFDARNQVVRRIDALGQSTQYAYHAAGKLWTVTDANQHTTTYRYDGADRLISVTDALGATQTHEYDASGNCTGVVDANGNAALTSDAPLAVALRRRVLGVDAPAKEALTGPQKQALAAAFRTSYQYDANGRVIDIVDPAGGHVRYAYDANGNRTQVTDALGHVQTTCYDLAGRTILSVDALGAATSYVYDASGRVIRQTVSATPLSLPVDPAHPPVPAIAAGDRTTRFSYDDLGRMVRRIDAEGGLTTYGYDAVGNRTETRQALDTAGTRWAVTQSAYDAANRLRFQRSAEGVLSETRYDAAGNIVALALYEQPGALPAPGQAGPAGPARITSFAYDALNRRTWTVSAGLAATRTDYDAVGNVLTATRLATPLSARPADGAVPAPAASAADEITSFAYDAANRETFRVDAAQNVVARRYDAVGNVLEIRAHATPLAARPAPGAVPAPVADAKLDQVTTFVYDANGREIFRIDAERAVTRTDYDAAGRAVSTTAYATPLAARPASGQVPQPAGSTQDQVASFVYDAAGRLAYAIDAEGAVTGTRYDTAGNVISRTAYGQLLAGDRPAAGMTPDAFSARLNDADVRNQVTSLVYDRDNRLVVSIDPEGAVTQLRHDAAGHVLQRLEMARLYTAARPAAGATPASVLALVSLDPQADRLTSSVFDLDGNVSFEIDASNAVTAYTYDTMGKVLSRTVHATALLARPALDATPAQVQAQVTQWDRTDSFVYDADGRLRFSVDGEMAVVEFRHDAFGNVVQSREYAARATARLNSAGSAPAVVSDEGKDRLTSSSYDAMNRLAFTVDAELHVTARSYDAFGNLAGVSRFANALSGRPAPGVSPSLRQSAPTGSTTTPWLVMDPARDAVTTLSYDLRNQLRFTVDAELHVTEQRMDAFGNVARRIAYANAATARPAAGVAPMVVSNPVYGPNVSQVVESAAKDRVQSFNYDRDNRQRFSVDGELGVTEWRYDAFGNALMQRAYDAKASSRDGGPAGAPVVVAADDKDAITSWVYDRDNRLVFSIDGEGFVTQTVYDTFGDASVVTVYEHAVDRRPAPGQAPLPLSTPPTGQMPPWLLIDPSRDHRTTITHDRNGRVISETRSIDASKGVRTEYDYDTSGNRITVTEAAGTADARRTQFGYDRANRLTDTTRALGDAASVTTHLVLDSAGRVIERHDAFGAGAEERVTQYAYDRNGQLTVQVDAMGTRTRHVLDAFGNVTRRVQADGTGEARLEQRSYDRNGQLLSVTDPAGGTTHFGYDSFGQRISETNADFDPLVLPLPNGQVLDVTRGAYYARLRNRLLGLPGSQSVLSLDDAEKAILFERTTTRTVYDRNGRPISRTDPAGVRTDYAYDARGNLRTETQAAGVAGQERVTTRRHDREDRLIELTDALGGVTTFGYDVLGNLTRQTDARGFVETRAYDALGRLVRIDGPGATDAERTRITQTYDARGNVLSSTQSRLDGSDARTTRYVLDLLDRVIAVTDGEDFTTTFSYDRFGNKTGMVAGQYLRQPSDAAYDAAKAQRAFPLATSFTYDASDRLLSMVDGDGDITRYAYDRLGRRTQVTQAENQRLGTVQRITRYQFDGADRVLSVSTPAGGQTRYVYGYAGVAIQQTDLQWTAGDYLIANGDTWDSIVQKVYGASNSDHSVDILKVLQSQRFQGQVPPLVAGGLLQALPATLNGHPRGAAWGEVTATRSFEYDADLRLTAEIDPYQVRTEHAYDAVGNVLRHSWAVGTTDERSVRMNYDLLGRKTADIDGEQRTTTYAYDAQDHLVRVTDALGGITRHYYDGAGQLRATRDAEGYLTTFTVDAAGNRTAETRFMARDTGPGNDTAPPAIAPAEGDLTALTVLDRANRVLSRTEPDGTRTRFVYNGAGLKSDEVLYDNTSAARTRHFDYDADGRVRRVTDIDQSTTDYTYDALGNLLSEALGRAPASGDPIVTRLTSYTYDLNNRIVQRRLTGVDVAGAATLLSDLRTGYDAAGHVVGETTMDGLAGGTPTASAAHLYRYDLAGRRVSSRDELNLETQYVYDRIGNVILVTDPRYSALSDSDVTQSAIKGQHSTQYKYDRNNRRVQEILPVVDIYTIAGGAQASVHPVIDTKYDALGRVVETSDANNDKTTCYYDGLGRLTGRLDADGAWCEYEYDAAGRLTSSLESMTRVSTPHNPAKRPVRPAGELRVTTYAYDKAGRLTLTTLPSIQTTNVLESTSTDPIVQIKTTVPDERHMIDAFGDERRTRDRDGNYAYAWYDVQHRRIATIDTAGYLTRFDYDTQGNVTRQRVYATPYTLAQRAALNLTNGFADLPAPPSGEVYETLRVFDAASRVVMELGPKVDVLQSIAGSTANTTAGRYVTRTTYDLAGNAVAVSHGFQPDSAQAPLMLSTEHRVFDAAHRQTAMVDAKGTVFTFAYDGVGNMTQSTRYYGALSSTDGFVIDGNTTREMLLSHLTVDLDANRNQYTAYEYDDLNRLRKQTDRMATGAADDLIKRFDVDRVGNRTRVIDEDGFVTAMAYDGKGRLVESIAPNGASRGDFNAAGNNADDYTDAVFEYDVKGNVVRSYTGMTGKGVKIATDLSAVTTGAAVQISWQARQGAATSWIVWDDGQSHAVIEGDAQLALYAKGATAHLNVNAFGNASTLTQALVPAGNGPVYFRVVTQDAAGNLAWSEEREWRRPAVPAGAPASDPVPTVLKVSERSHAGMAGKAGRAAAEKVTGYISESVYNALDAKIRSNDQDGRYRAFGVNALGAVVSTRTFSDDETSSIETGFARVDERGRLLIEWGARMTAPDGSVRRPVTRRAYNVFDQITELKTPDGGPGWKFGYNALGIKISEINPLDVHDPKNPSQDFNGTTRYYLDLFGNVTATRSARGDFTRRIYNAGGQLTTERDATGNETAYGYDRVGRLISKTDGRGAASATIGDYTMRYEYDNRDRLLKIRQAQGWHLAHSNLQIDRDARQRMGIYTNDANLLTAAQQTVLEELYTTAFTYDGRNHRQTTTTHADITAGAVINGNGSAQVLAVDTRHDQVVTEFYDGQNRIWVTYLAARLDGLSPDAVSSTWTQSDFDTYGNLVRETRNDGNGSVQRSHTYGRFGRLLKDTDEAGLAVNYGYDVYGRVTSETSTSALGTDGALKNVSKGYDEAGRLMFIDDKTLGHRTDYTYTMAGLRRSERGVTKADYTYDAMGRITGWTNGTDSIAVTYDANGNRRTDGGQTFTYDADNRVTSVTGSNGKLAWSFTYDAAGNRRSVTDSTFRSYFYYDSNGATTVDANNRVVKTRGTGGTTGDDTVTDSKAFFDARGNTVRVEETIGNGRTRTVLSTFNELNQAIKTTSIEAYQFWFTGAGGDTQTLHQDVTTQRSRFDAAGRVQESWSRHVVSENGWSDVDDFQTKNVYTYFADGREKTQSAFKLWDDGGSESLGTTVHFYDADKRHSSIDYGQGAGKTRHEIRNFGFDNEGHMSFQTHDDGLSLYSSDHVDSSNSYAYANGVQVLAYETRSKSDGTSITTNLFKSLGGGVPDGGPLTSAPASPGGMNYTVHTGDTLQSVASAVYGNSALWYVIAAENGLPPNAALPAGKVLHIPVTAQAGGMGADGHRVYNESALIGSSLPNVPADPNANCKAVATIVATVVTAVVVSVATWGAGSAIAGAAAAAVVSGALTATEAAAVVISGTAVAGAAIAATGSLVSQGALVLGQVQRGIDGREIGLAALGGALSGASAGLGGATKLLATAGKLSTGISTALRVGQGAVKLGQAAVNVGLRGGNWSSFALNAFSAVAGVGGIGVPAVTAATAVASTVFGAAESAQRRGGKFSAANVANLVGDLLHTATDLFVPGDGSVGATVQRLGWNVGSTVAGVGAGLIDAAAQHEDASGVLLQGVQGLTGDVMGLTSPLQQLATRAFDQRLADLRGASRIDALIDDEERTGALNSAKEGRDMDLRLARMDADLDALKSGVDAVTSYLAKARSTVDRMGELTQALTAPPAVAEPAMDEGQRAKDLGLGSFLTGAVDRHEVTLDQATREYNHYITTDQGRNDLGVRGVAERVYRYVDHDTSQGGGAASYRADVANAKAEIARMSADEQKRQLQFVGGIAQALSLEAAADAVTRQAEASTLDRMNADADAFIEAGHIAEYGGKQDADIAIHDRIVTGVNDFVMSGFDDSGAPMYREVTQAERDAQVADIRANGFSYSRPLRELAQTMEGLAAPQGGFNVMGDIVMSGIRFGANALDLIEDPNIHSPRVQSQKDAVVRDVAITVASEGMGRFVLPSLGRWMASNRALATGVAEEGEMLAVSMGATGRPVPSLRRRVAITVDPINETVVVNLANDGAAGAINASHPAMKSLPKRSLVVFDHGGVTLEAGAAGQELRFTGRPRDLSVYIDGVRDGVAAMKALTGEAPDFAVAMTCGGARGEYATAHLLNDLVEPALGTMGFDGAAGAVAKGQRALKAAGTKTELITRNEIRGLYDEANGLLHGPSGPEFLPSNKVMIAPVESPSGDFVGRIGAATPDVPKVMIDNRYLGRGSPVTFGGAQVPTVPAPISRGPVQAVRDWWRDNIIIPGRQAAAIGAMEAVGWMQGNVGASKGLIKAMAKQQNAGIISTELVQKMNVARRVPGASPPTGLQYGYQGATIGKVGGFFTVVLGQ